MKTIAVIGGGPAGLRAAEIASQSSQVVLFDAKASVGRKFLVAGKGGLNITKCEDFSHFATQYRGADFPEALWTRLLAEFDPEALRQWAAGLGVETFVASTGRVYPREMKAAPLLRRWVQRLRANGVVFHLHHRWSGLLDGSLEFSTPHGLTSYRADAVILALGGGSWPETGSDGRWTAILENHGIAISPLAPANCGWEVDWTPALLAEAEGRPLKNITATADGQTAKGELLITRYGLEGGVIYQLGSALRETPQLTIDLKPGVPEDQLIRKLGPLKKNFLAEARSRWRLSDAAFALLAHMAEPPISAETLAKATKAFPITLLRPRPLAEAISSVGGVTWSELDDHLMLKKLPGVFCAGEMIDWEAPTGGYLMQGCFASGSRAARAALAHLGK